MAQKRGQEAPGGWRDLSALEEMSAVFWGDNARSLS
jgi:hypothetical protein